METNRCTGHENGKVNYLHIFGTTVINLPTQGGIEGLGLLARKSGVSFGDDEI